ncbi:MAG: chorismate mutase [Oscillospiraceae bacterium]|nr:chorismate mutase [Oscillospiraceae bacterium]
MDNVDKKSEARDQLAVLRGQIDDIDRQLVDLFLRRMRVSDEIAGAKRRGGIGVTDRERERAVIEAARAGAGNRDRDFVAAFMQSLITLSKQRQERQNPTNGEKDL